MKRCKIDNEMTCFQETTDINIDRIAYSGVWIADNHLPGMDKNGISEMTGAIESPVTFQNQNLVYSRVVLEHNGGAADGGSDPRCMNSSPFGALRNLNKDRAIA